MPESVCVPVPVLVNRVVPDPFWITPLKVVEVLLPPVVSVFVVAVELLTAPLPASEPMEISKPFRSSVPFAVTAELLPNAVVEPAFNVPALTVVAPV